MGNNYQVLSEDKNFNKGEYENILNKNKGLESLAIAEYRFMLLKDRDAIADFSDSKENVQRLFIESFTDSEYKKLLERLKANQWTIEQAYNKVKTTGRTIEYISRIKNI